MVHVRSAASIGELKMKEWNTLHPKTYYRALTKCHIIFCKNRENSLQDMIETTAKISELRLSPWRKELNDVIKERFPQIS